MTEILNDKLYYSIEVFHEGIQEIYHIFLGKSEMEELCVEMNGKNMVYTVYQLSRSASDVYSMNDINDLDGHT